MLDEYATNTIVETYLAGFEGNHGARCKHRVHPFCRRLAVLKHRNRRDEYSNLNLKKYTIF
jgi:hypothetical protein